MYFGDKALFVVLFVALAMGIGAEKRDCSNNCLLFFRCDPYFDEPVWTIQKGVCKVYRNACIFGTENCARENRCLKPLEQVSKEKCQRKCAVCEKESKSPICATFTYIGANGERLDDNKTFESICLADKYACENAQAYVSFNEGACT